MKCITVSVRVRYVECDPMGVAHHSVYPIWFEIARTELLRQSGVAYAELERAGTLIVVVKLQVSYKKPAHYDDLLDITATVTRSGGVRIEHQYEVRRGQELLCTGATTLACLDRNGRLTAVPDQLALHPSS